ncbi:MAG TPA: OmpA family protein [Cyclobacteriaceae bacterium]|jgi:outer membrane protein OmpA-like peptidoglycan-associated protein
MRIALIFILSVAVVSISRSQEFAPRHDFVNMGKHVNTHNHEAAPVVSPDGNTLYFFVDTQDSQDIWMTQKDEAGEWSAPERLGSPFNNNRSNQVFTVFKDGTLFIKGGRGKDKKGFSLVKDGRLTEIKVKDFDNMNQGRFYGATMSEDRKHMIIYFSERKGSAASDLYVSHAQADGTWSRPVKLKISHSMDDFAPFIGPDQKTLYYASGRPGEGRQGGTDIYKTTRLDDSWENWSTPVNMGKPVNTAAMDYYFSIDESGNAFVSRSNSRIDGGNLDLFVLVSRDITIKLVGNVFDEKTKETLAANVELTLNEGKIRQLTTDASGSFETKLPEIESYALNVSSDGYHSYSNKFNLPTFDRDTTLMVDIFLKPVEKKLVLQGEVFNKKTGEKLTADLNVTVREHRDVKLSMKARNGDYQREISKLGWYIISASAEGFINTTDSVWINSADVTPIVKDIYLQPIEVGVTVRLKNVYFDFDKTTLKEESYPELDKVVDFLQQNPTVEIEIAGHTDYKGSDEYNLNLSQGRCQSVVDYLISRGIDSYRLTAQGYGESRPIDTNETDEGRANNRRVEFTVLKK